MNKWPKKWLAEVNRVTGNVYEGDKTILDNLHKIGALKDPQKPREYWICPDCSYACKGDRSIFVDAKICSKGHKTIHVREVMEGEE